MNRNKNNSSLNKEWPKNLTKQENCSLNLQHIGTIFVFFLLTSFWTTQTISAESDHKNITAVVDKNYAPDQIKPLIDIRDKKSEHAITRRERVCFYTVVTLGIWYVTRDLYTTSGVSECNRDEYQDISSLTIKTSLNTSVRPHRAFKSGIHQYVADPGYSVSEEYHSIGIQNIWKHLSMKMPWWRIISDATIGKDDSYPLYFPIPTHGLRSYSWKTLDRIDLIITNENRMFALVSMVVTKPPITRNQVEKLLNLPKDWRYFSKEIKKPLHFSTSAPAHSSVTLFDDLGNIWIELIESSINHAIETDIAPSQP